MPTAVPVSGEETGDTWPTVGDSLERLQTWSKQGKKPETTGRDGFPQYAEPIHLPASISNWTLFCERFHQLAFSRKSTRIHCQRAMYCSSKRRRHGSGCSRHFGSREAFDKGSCPACKQIWTRNWSLPGFNPTVNWAE